MPGIPIASTALLSGSPSDLTFVWTLVCAALVLLMQAGFCMLESGLSRSKHSINVAIKNLADLCVSSIAFWMIGFGVMFGVSQEGWFGTSHFAIADDPAMMTFALFQIVFCGTATTIVSGAVAERMKFGSYLVVCSFIAVFIYPIFGHWAWGGIIPNTGLGWLAQIGFIDFAGATVVHAMGGWIALASILILGPRKGRFDSGGDSGKRMTGQDYPAATAGVILLWFGWIGFNGGSLLDVDDSIPRIVLNTVLAGAAGGIAAMLCSFVREHRVQPSDIFGGVVAGLVAVTAGCNVYGPLAAVPIALIAGMIYAIGAMALERFRIDDVIGAVPAHALAGAWGTIAVAFFAEESMLSTGLTRWDQVQVQCIGTLAAFIWGFGGGGLVLIVTNRLLGLRVSEDAEHFGLNVVEHGTSTATVDLLDDMDRNRRGDFDRRVNVEPNTEVGQIASLYNGVLDRFQDETASRLAATEALQQAEAEYRLMFENSVEGVYRRDADGTITAANPSYATLLGFASADEAIAAGADAIAEQYTAHTFPYSIEECDDPKEYRATILVNGEQREILERVRALRDPETKTLLWIQAAVTDITETMHAEQLEHQVAVANAANAAKSEFLASMSHELRTPLHGVSGMLELMGTTPLNDEQKKLLGNARFSADALMSQINDVLDLSKIESGMLELKPVTFDVVTLVENVVAAFSSTVPTDEVELICDISRLVPRHVVGDAGRLRQILANLLGNAVKFTREGEIRTTIDMTVHDRIQFVISDTGPGMDEEILAKIFEPYTQGNSQSSHCKGTGLGLAICSELAAAMGGEIHVESELGRGAVFTVLLPLPIASETVPQDATSPGNGPLRILAVDDRRSNLNVLHKQLSCWNHDVVTLQDPAQVETVLREAIATELPFDLLVVDHQMPGRDGIEVASAVRSEIDLEGIPIIVATSHPLGVPEAEREIAGVAAVIEKPIRQSDLFNGILTATNDEAMFAEESVAKRPFDIAIDIRVLVAEDNAINQAFCRHVLESAGFDVTIVDDGQPAVDAFIEAAKGDTPFDVVLMDCQMIETDGFEATRLIREWEEHENRQPSSIVALTANAIVGDRDKCVAAGMTDYLTKPIDAETLRSAVREFATSTSMQQAAPSENAVEQDQTANDDPSANPVFPSAADLETEEDYRDHEDVGTLAKQSQADRIDVNSPDDDAHEQQQSAENSPNLLLLELRERCLDDDNFMYAVLEQFSQELPGLLGNLINAVSAGDWPQAAESAHALKGVSGNVSAEKLHIHVSGIEKSIRVFLDDSSQQPNEEAIMQLVDDAEDVLTEIGKLVQARSRSHELTENEIAQ